MQFFHALLEPLCAATQAVDATYAGFARCTTAKMLVVCALHIFAFILLRAHVGQKAVASAQQQILQYAEDVPLPAPGGGSGGALRQRRG